jgi:hypothetical protein
VTSQIFEAEKDINSLLSHFNQSNKSTPKHIYLVFDQDINTIQERDDEIQEERERANGDIPFLDYSPLLGGSPDTTPNVISTSTDISTVSSFPASTPDQQIEALWEKVAPSKNGSGDDLSSDDFNSDDMPTLEARITVSPAPDPTPAPAPAPASIPSKLIDLNILVDLTFLLAFAPAPPTKPPLKSILKRKRQVEVTISSDDDDNRSDLDDGGKELPGDGDYRPGNRRRGNRGQFKKARTE